tara:strand:- start:1718 stop:1948 length:231 start_codon:yes stop_codon:yes gene_type:complete
MSALKVEKLLNHKHNLHKKMYELEDAINKIRKEISSTNIDIFSTCEHKWVRDWEVDSGCKKICCICNLSANPNYNP